MDTILIVLGILLIIVIAFGIYKLSTRGLHESNFYRPDKKASRRNGFQTFLLVVVTVIGLGLIFWAFSNLL